MRNSAKARGNASMASWISATIPMRIGCSAAERLRSLAGPGARNVMSRKTVMPARSSATLFSAPLGQLDVEQLELNCLTNLAPPVGVQQLLLGPILHPEPVPRSRVFRRWNANTRNDPLALPVTCRADHRPAGLRLTIPL